MSDFKARCTEFDFRSVSDPDHALGELTALPRPLAVFNNKPNKQTVYWILAASKGWIKQTYRKIMHTQNTQNNIAGNDLGGYV